jgi:hypothetical protein
MLCHRILCSVPLLLVAAACGASSPPSIANKGGDRQTDGPVDCAASQFKAREVCFDHAQAACDSLACKEGCDILRSRTSKMIICSSNAGSSSKLSRCGGIANWQCPENTVCADDPHGTCKRDTADDCIGLCVPAQSSSK